jgi:hypothetical protein
VIWRYSAADEPEWSRQTVKQVNPDVEICGREQVTRRVEAGGPCARDRDTKGGWVALPLTAA